MDCEPDELTQRQDRDLKRLREQQLDEAIALGASLAYQESLKQSSDEACARQTERLLTTTMTEAEVDEEATLQNLLAEQYPAFRKALDRVRDV